MHEKTIKLYFDQECYRIMFKILSPTFKFTLIAKHINTDNVNKLINVKITWRKSSTGKKIRNRLK